MSKTFKSKEKKLAFTTLQGIKFKNIEVIKN